MDQEICGFPSFNTLSPEASFTKHGVVLSVALLLGILLKYTDVFKTISLMSSRPVISKQPISIYLLSMQTLLGVAPYWTKSFRLWCTELG